MPESDAWLDDNWQRGMQGAKAMGESIDADRWRAFREEELLKLRYVLIEAGCTEMHARLRAQVDAELGARGI